MPPETEIQMTVDWLDPNWEDRKHTFTVINNASGASAVFSPGNWIAKVTMLCNLKDLPPGSLSIITWETNMPDIDGVPQKIYSGAYYFPGNGLVNQYEENSIVFPYARGTQDASKIIWKVLVKRPGLDDYENSKETRVTYPMVSFLKSDIFSKD
jgi:hypothetical protein